MITPINYTIGNIHSFSVADPTAGTGFVIRPDEEEVWRLLGFRFLFTSSVVVATRGVVVEYYNGLQDSAFFFTNFNHTASLAIKYSAMQILTGENAYSRNGYGRCMINWNENFLITHSHYVRVTADNIVSSDTFTNIRGICERWTRR